VTKELVISANRHETRVAILEDDQVVEVYHQRENEYSLAGSIHKGKVTRVLPGMQSAFVDIGLERDAFLYVSDFFEDNEEYDKIVTSVEEKVLKLERGPQQGTSAAVTAAPPETEAAAPPAPPSAAPESAPLPETAAAGIATIPPPAPAFEPRGDRGGERGDRGDRGDRGGRGRRGRRRGRGGQKGGGRGLPESKFYSPGRGPAVAPGPEYRSEPPAEALEPPAAAPEADDFLVLPGESLAKYGNDGAQLPALEPEQEDAETEQELSPAEPVTTSDVAFEPPAEPQPELAEAIEEAEDEAAVEAEPAPQAAAAVETPAPEPAGPEAVAEEVAVEDEEAAVPEGDPAEEESDPFAAPLETAEAGEVSDAADTSEAGIAEAVEEEGPEPARIPTSLTATLREQGARYPHRVSRRMRRRGGRGDSREGREGRDSRDQRHAAPPAEAGAPASMIEPRGEQRPISTPKPDARTERPGAPSIADLLKQGQEIIVQIAKEPLGQKGARITSHIALPGRFLVYMPTVDHIGVSRKIPSDEERSRLKRILQGNRSGIPGGFIVRTAGEGHTEEELRADMMFLYNLWLDMRQKAERKPAPMLIHHDLSVVERVLRDQLTSAFKSIWVDNEELYENILRFVQRFQPGLVSRVKLYTRSNPIFDEFNITSELEKALRPKVWLKSGGHIVINQTEALVAIDVNTGKFVGKSNRLEDTIVKTNTDAIKEIVRQIRLRDLGGIIVVDFIDMDERKNRQKVMQALEEAMRADKAPYKILQFNDFGLVAITRKRVKQSLERTLCTPCPYCEGAGYVKSPQTVVGEILQEAQKLAKTLEGKDVMLRVAPDVARLLKSNQNSYLQELEEILGRTVIVKSDQQLHQEKFDLA
jgi:ribonuclease G